MTPSDRFLEEEDGDVGKMAGPDSSSSSFLASVGDGAFDGTDCGRLPNGGRCPMTASSLR